MTARANHACHVCGRETLIEVPEYAHLSHVTSDCKPWPRDVGLGVCTTCGCVQKRVDDRWRTESESIYADYALFHQGDSSDQPAYETATGRAAPRNVRLVERLRTHVRLPPTGRLLDTGCGRGTFLRPFADRFPGWSLVGCDPGRVDRTEIEAIPGVEAFWAAPADDVPGLFDLISMSHVLEHVPDPIAVLSSLRSKLNLGGLLVIHGPNLAANPFDLLVADHCSHFVASSLKWIARAAGFEVEFVAEDWVEKEQTLLARPRRPMQPLDKSRAVGTHTAQRMVGDALGWLARLAEDARALAGKSDLGIFGTAIAGVWLDTEIGGNGAFFCDEHPACVGKPLFGRPVIHPADIEGPSDVYVPIPAPGAHRIAQRLARAGIRYHLPPAVR